MVSRLESIDVHVLGPPRPGLCGAVGTQPQLVIVVEIAHERPAVGTLVLSGARLADLTEAADAHDRQYDLEGLESEPGTFGSRPDRTVPTTRFVVFYRLQHLGSR